MKYSVAAFISVGAVALGVIACAGHGSVSPVPSADGASSGARRASANVRRAQVLPGRAAAAAAYLGVLRRPRTGTVSPPIADEALQVGHAYPNHEKWTFANAGLDPSCGSLDWSYDNKIPGVTVTVNPTTTSLDGDVEVSFGQLPDDTKTDTYANQIIATCSNPKATGTVAGPTSISVAAVSLDITTVPQDGSDGTNVTGKTFTTIVGKFQELDASPEPEVTLLQNTWKLPGDTVKTYTETKAKASVALLDAGDLAQQQLNFYWIHGTAGKALQVPLSVVFPVFNSRCAPGACSGAEAYWGLADAEASVNVLAPTVAGMTSTTGVVATDARDGGLNCLEGMHFGFADTTTKRCAPAGTSRGIFWRMAARVPVDGQGDLDATQLIRRTDAIVPLKGAKAVPTAYPSTKNNYELDNCLRHGNVASAHVTVASDGEATYEGEETPGLGLSPDWSSLDDEDSYITNFVYKPTDIVGTTPDRLNIWVPLGSLTWSWSGIATNSSTDTIPVWKLARSANTDAPKGVFATPAPLPTWSAFYSSRVTTCPAGG